MHKGSNARERKVNSMGHSLTLPCLVGRTERRRRPSVRWKVRQIPCFPSRLMELQNASRPLLSPAKPAHAHICQASEPARKWRGVSTTSAPAFHTVQVCLRRFVIDSITFHRKLLMVRCLGPNHPIRIALQWHITKCLPVLLPGVESLNP